MNGSTAFNLGSFSDPGLMDSPWTVDVDWGDGSSDTFNTATAGALGTRSHTYTAVGPFTVTVKVTDKDGDWNSATFKVSVKYATGGSCLGAPGHQILQPINADGTSIFKKGSTVPAKFRVCDANGNSIGTPGVVSNFKVVKKVYGTTETAVNEDVISTTPDTAFRWDPTDQQWIFNIHTKNLTAGYTYYYEITLNDGTKILFQFGLK